MKKPNSTFDMFLKLFVQFKLLPQNDAEKGDLDEEKRVELRRKIRKGSSLAILVMAIIWWRRKKIRRRVYSRQSHVNGIAHLLFRDRIPKKKDDHRSAVEAPLSVLLAAAKKGIIVEALMNSSTIVYKLGEEANENSNGASSSSLAGSGTGPLPTKWKKSILPKDNPSVAKELMNKITDSGCLEISILKEPLSSRIGPMLLTAFPFIYLFLLYHMLKRLQKGQTDDEAGTNYLRETDKRTTTFKDVAGIDTAQVELQEIVSYLSNPKPYLGLGATPPRGLLLHGKPGLGKTLLARAVAGEANADHFVTCSGSDFVEIYVGQGAKRVRNLFSDARAQAIKKWKKQHIKIGNGLVPFLKGYLPFSKTHSGEVGFGRDFLRPPTAVIFIDEIDALAKCRDGIGHGMLHGGSGGNDEREQTLNALLAEMDGFNKSDALIIVIAAKNRLPILDPALMRPGRFDRHVKLSPPDAVGRESILKVHARDKKLDEDVDLCDLSRDHYTANFSGAELRNVMNEAALLAVREGSETIQQKHLYLSVERLKVMKSYAAY